MSNIGHPYLHAAFWPQPLEEPMVLEDTKPAGPGVSQQQHSNLSSEFSK